MALQVGNPDQHHCIPWSLWSMWIIPPLHSYWLTISRVGPSHLCPSCLPASDSKEQWTWGLLTHGFWSFPLSLSSESPNSLNQSHTGLLSPCSQVQALLRSFALTTTCLKSTCPPHLWPEASPRRPLSRQSLPCHPIISNFQSPSNPLPNSFLRTLHCLTSVFLNVFVHLPYQNVTAQWWEEGT